MYDVSHSFGGYDKLGIYIVIPGNCGNQVTASIMCQRMSTLTYRYTTPDIEFIRVRQEFSEFLDRKHLVKTLLGFPYFYILLNFEIVL